MSEPLFDVFMLGSLAAAIAHRRSPHRYRWAVLAGVLAGLAVPDPRERARSCCCRSRSPCGTGGPRVACARCAAPALLVVARAPDDHAVDDPQRAQAPPLRPGLDAARLRAGGHLQRPGRGGHAEPRLVALAAARARSTRTSSPASSETNEAGARAGAAAPLAALHPRAPGLRGDRSPSGRRCGCSTSAASTGRGTRRRRSASTATWAIAGVLCFWVFALLAVAGAFTQAGPAHADGSSG